jgi:hypothetical protein
MRIKEKASAGAEAETGGVRRLLAVVSDGFNRAALFRLLAESFLFGSLRLLVDVTVAAIIVTLEIRGRSLTAKVAVDALIIHEVFADDILRIFVC